MKPARPPSIPTATLSSALALAILLLPCLAWAQQPKSEPIALPQPVAPTPAETAAQPSPPPLPVAAPLAPPKNAPLPPKPAAPLGKGEMLLNFQGASLTDVLNYLSEAAGFVIVQEAKVEGTVNVVSRQPINATEAVDLLNTVLTEKGFVAIRNGRILKIVKREGAQRRDLPVQTGSDPELIPRNDEMVTQILPLRYGEAAKLVENLRPLLAENSTISANDSSNSILLTDTQTNIRRIAQIIRAIDTSVASISTIHVYPLQFANAKDLATVITQLFANNTTGQSGRRGGFGGFGGFGGPGGPGGRGEGQQPAVQSEAKQAASRVVAVADDQSNSVIVSAPEDVIPTITEIVEKLDTSINDITETRIFRLQHADASELAIIVTSLYADTTTQANQARSQGGRGGGPGGGFGNNGGRGGQNQTNQPTGRALLQSKVVAVGDPRTNSLVVTSARDTMMEIAETVGRLDATDAKKQRVYVHALEHADADSVATVLRGMLGDQTAISNSQQSGANRLNNRSASGAEMDTSDISNTGGGAGGGGRGGR